MENLPFSQQLILVLAGSLGGGVIALIGAMIAFRGNLPGMAKNAFEVAKQATDKVVELEGKVAHMEAMFDGTMRVTASFSMKNLLQDGYAPLENGRIELINPEKMASERSMT